MNAEYEKQLKEALRAACMLLEIEAADHRLAPDRTDASHKRIANTLEAFTRKARTLIFDQSEAA